MKCSNYSRVRIWIRRTDTVNFIVRICLFGRDKSSSVLLLFTNGYNILMVVVIMSLYLWFWWTRCNLHRCSVVNINLAESSLSVCSSTLRGSSSSHYSSVRIHLRQLVPTASSSVVSYSCMPDRVCMASVIHESVVTHSICIYQIIRLSDIGKWEYIL